MRQLMKWALRRIWRMAAFLHRPLVRGLDRFAARQLEPLRFQVDRCCQQVSLLLQVLSQHPATRLNIPDSNLNLRLDSLVREQVRMQMQIEVLQQTLQQSKRNQMEMEATTVDLQKVSSGHVQRIEKGKAA